MKISKNEEKIIDIINQTSTYKPNYENIRAKVNIQTTKKKPVFIFKYALSFVFLFVLVVGSFVMFNSKNIYKNNNQGIPTDSEQSLDGYKKLVKMQNISNNEVIDLLNHFYSNASITDIIKYENQPLKKYNFILLDIDGINYMGVDDGTSIKYYCTKVNYHFKDIKKIMEDKYDLNVSSISIKYDNENISFNTNIGGTVYSITEEELY